MSLYFPSYCCGKIVASEIGLGATSIAAALLHDVVEDTLRPLRILNEFLTKSSATCRRTKISLVQKDMNVMKPKTS
jgi:GTP pyrophosphokinase